MTRSPVRGIYDRTEGGALGLRDAERGAGGVEPRHESADAPSGRMGALARRAELPQDRSVGRSGSEPRVPPAGSARMTTTELVVRTVARSLASQVADQLGKPLLRGILGGRSR